MTKLEKLYLVLLSALITISLISNLVYQHFVHLFSIYGFTLELSAGTLLYPVSYFLINLITEYYGKEKADFAALNTVFMGILVSLIIFVVSLLPATTWSIVSDAEFGKVFYIFHLSFFSSLIASYISQRIEIRTYLDLKKIFGSKYLWLISSLSIFIGMIIDTFLIIFFLTIIGSLPRNFFSTIIMGSYLYKIFFLILLAPITGYLTNKRKFLK